MASYQYSYVMKDLSKTFAGGREVLKGITLSFLPDAKIGVLGVNGAGKSTLLKIMAGQDPEFTGEAWAADGVRVGYLEQEPELDPSKDVEGNVMEGLGETKAARIATYRHGFILDDDDYLKELGVFSVKALVALHGATASRVLEAIGR